MRVITLSIIIILLCLVLLNPAVAETQIEINSIFSDENSMDITLLSNEKINNGLIVFSLSHDNEILESQTLELDIIPDIETTRVIFWGKHFQFGAYEATARVYNNGELAAEAVDSFTYGFEALPRFQIVDLSPTSSGTNLLLTPRSEYQPGVGDFSFQLIKSGKIIYSHMEEDIPVIQTTRISINWPILLEDHTDYIVRLKSFSHVPKTITTYSNGFTSQQDVEIDETDVDVDDFGVSVTLFGKSQVPFDGIVEVELQKDGTIFKTYSGKPDILTLGRDDTVGIIWNDLDPGAYKVLIKAKTLDGEIMDRYETVLSIPEKVNPVGTPEPKTPGFSAIMGIFSVIIMTLIWKKR
ncbi:MAG: hypothetical protein E4G94_12530 [ANME-2 cluster archaeon]|nr:MAG: hypothetical protein E4G94_12530 [ANME-2 cluster archaeon]